jgi:organic radical activating enzyme
MLKRRKNMTQFDKRSFSSAETIPVKLFVNEELWKSCVSDGKIIPIHLQLNPTNKCWFECSFCSCGNRDRSIELDWENLKRFLVMFKRLGGQSVTITGGGEPLLYSHINDLILYLYELNIHVGVVTNGSAWLALKPDVFKGVVWCRVSASDELPTQLQRLKRSSPNILDDWFRDFKRQMFLYPNVDWALSYVLSKRPNIPLIKRMINFTNENNLTHMRIVSDILRADQIETVMDKLKEEIQHSKINDDVVNYQGRASWSKGQEKCWLSLAKPVVGADGYLYPCCGTQYALKDATGDYPESMRLGYMFDLPRLITSQECFNGSVCHKCYYQSYNEHLDPMKNAVKIKHRRFI